MFQTNLQSDKIFLKETLKLAKRGIGWTYPNPMVGGVLVKNGKIVGRGYHHQVGNDHAEIVALKSAKETTKGSTLYVNLEPCSHYGRTPPCVETIIKSGITRVVCSTADPNPQVNGQGIKILKNAGIEVQVGTLESGARKLNDAYFTYHKKKRPFIALKFAASLDGKIATKTSDSKWITNKKSREFARELRSYYQSILVGVNTVIRDDPHLGIRIKGKRDPLRIILDSQLKIPLSSQVLRNQNVLVATTQRADRNKLERSTNLGISTIVFDGDEISLNDLLSELRRREIISILVEGGGKILGSFLDERLVDKVYAFHAPILIGGEKSVPAIGGNGVTTLKEVIKLKNVSFKRFGDNMLTIGYV